MSKSAASATGSSFVDHGWFVADRYRTLGANVVNSYYPKDHTHTSPAGAKTVTETFFRGLQCGSAGLKNYLSSTGRNVPSQTCGGI
jgi:rhamnogalacturonan acetylesterase